MASPNAGPKTRDSAEIIAFPLKLRPPAPPPGRSDSGLSNSGRSADGRAGANQSDRSQSSANQSGAIELAKCAARLTAYRIRAAASAPDPDCDAAWYHAAAILEEETWRKQ